MKRSFRILRIWAYGKLRYAKRTKLIMIKESRERWTKAGLSHAKKMIERYSTPSPFIFEQFVDKT